MSAGKESGTIVGMCTCLILVGLGVKDTFIPDERGADITTYFQRERDWLLRPLSVREPTDRRKRVGPL